MRGRQVFMDSLRAHGVRYIFGNPGTTESPLLDSLHDYPDIRYVATLHEGVAVCAASFYAQASGTTAVANVHVAPGLGNGLGSLYGAMRAGSPLILTAGQQDSRMRLRDPMLQHDLVAMAAPLSKWSVQVSTANEMAPILRRAFKIANDPPRGPVFVALPIDVMEQETALSAETSGALHRRTLPDPDGVLALAELIAASRSPAIVAGDDVARADAGQALVELAEIAGAAVYHEGLRQHMPFPNRHPNHCGALGFEAGAISRTLERHDLVLLAGGPFFEEIWYDPVHAIAADTRVAQIADSPDVLARNMTLDVGVLGDLAQTLGALTPVLAERGGRRLVEAAARRNAELRSANARALLAIEERLKGGDALPMTSGRALYELAQALPDGGIVVDEAITAAGPLAQAFEFRDAHDYYGQRGGGIGQGIAGALGVKLAHPQRPVLTISGDGSAMYHVQSLWTAASLGLGIVFVVLANGEYRVLKHNLDAYRARFGVHGSNRPYPHMDFAPTLDFVSLARGLGVAGTRVDDPDDLARAARAAFASGEPHLLEVAVAGKDRDR